MSSKVLASKKLLRVVPKIPLKQRIVTGYKYFVKAPEKIQFEILMKIFSKMFLYIALTFGAVITLFPFYYMVVTALNPAEKLQSGRESIYWGCDFQFQNFAHAWNLDILKVGNIPGMPGDVGNTAELAGATLGTWFFNTIFTVLVNTVLTVFTTILAAFAIAKLKFTGRSKIFGILLMTMMIPGEILTIQNIVTINRLGWQNSYVAIIAPFISSVFYIFLLVQFFMGIPDSLYRAARVDGCGDWKYLWRVLVPMSTNTLATVSVLNAIASWNAFLWPSLIITSPSIQVLSVGLYDYTAAANGQSVFPAPNFVMAASVMVIAPMFIVYILLRKQIIAGVSRSGTKG